MSTIKHRGKMYRRLKDGEVTHDSDLYVAKDMAYYRKVDQDDIVILRQYAAIKLRVPQSGLEWLDDMIRESQRNEFAAQALAGYLACPDTHESWTHRVMAVQAYLQADQMLQAQKGGEA